MLKAKKHEFKEYPNIAISGKMGSGKTTIADYLAREYDYKKFHFAGPIKEAGAIIFGHDKVHHNRGLLQQFGLLMRTRFGKEVWVDAMSRALDAYDSYEPVVIDDCRFINEQIMLDNRDGEVWRFPFVSSDTETRFNRLQRIKKIEERIQMNHESEREMERMAFDWHISNTEDIASVFASADRMIERFAKRA